MINKPSLRIFIKKFNKNIEDVIKHLKSSSNPKQKFSAFNSSISKKKKFIIAKKLFEDDDIKSTIEHLMNTFYNTMQNVDKTNSSQFIITSKFISLVDTQSSKNLINITKSSAADSRLTQKRSFTLINSQNNRKNNPPFHSFIRTQSLLKNNSKSFQFTFERHQSSHSFISQ